MVAKFQALTFTGLTPSSAIVSVFDGEPDGPTIPDNFVVVMGETDRSAGTYVPAYLGNTSMYERYSVYVGVFSYIGGSSPADNSGNSDAEKTARANANVIHEGIGNAMKADRNLITANGGVTAPVIWCIIAGADYSQQSFGDLELGRYATWRARYDVLNVAT
jgi:hypothetical protein